MNEEIKNSIRQIRRALERFEKNDFDCMVNFHGSRDFPSGWCGDATDLLGLYLQQFHKIESSYVNGIGLAHNASASHAWLLCDGYIIDIIADQFNKKGYNLPSVIITKKCVSL